MDEKNRTLSSSTSIKSIKMRFDSSPEPVPEFHVAMEIWGAAFPVHVYTFAVLFMILSLYNVNSILGLALKAKHVKKKTIFMFTNIMLCSFNSVTSLQLFIDPYGSNVAMKLKGVAFLAFGMKLPCLTSAFSFIYIALIQTTKVKLYSSKLHNVKYFVAIVLIHFIVSLAVHLYLTMTIAKFKVVIICLAFFLLFSVAISFLFLFNYYKIKKLLGGNLVHVPTMKFHSSPNSKKDSLILSTHVEEQNVSRYKNYPDQFKALARGIVNKGLLRDNVKEEILVNNGIRKAYVISNEIDATLIQNENVVHYDIGSTVSTTNDDASLSIVNHGLDIEDGVQYKIMKDSDNSEKGAEEVKEKIEGKGPVFDDTNDGDDEEDNPDEGNVNCDDAGDVVDDITSKSNENNETQRSEAQLEDNISDQKLHETNEIQSKVTVYDVSDIELSDSEYGVPQSVTAENDPSYLRVPSNTHHISLGISSNNERLQQSDEVSQVSCNGYIIQTYSTTDTTPPTEKPTPILTTNVIASLKRPTSEDNGTFAEPSGNVASKFGLPNDRKTQRKQAFDMKLSRRKPAFVDKSLNKLLKLVVIVTLSSILYCSAIIYKIIIVVFDNKHLQTSAWPWLIYQTVSRVAELGMSGTMSYLVRRTLISFKTCKTGAQ